MEQLRVGVIGCGYWGPNLIRNLVSLPSSDVIAVADLNSKRLQHMKDLYPQLVTVHDYCQLFSMDLDAVVISTPPATHFRIAKECLEQDLHCLVEKPLTLSSNEALELTKLAKARSLKLMVGHTFEYNPAVRMLKDIVDSGELGEIYYINTVRVNLGLFQLNLNVLWDLAPHDISILHYVLGQKPTSIHAHGEACILDGKHDIAYLYMQFPSDVIAHTHVSWLDPNKVRRITVVGSKKMLVYDDVENVEKIKIYDKGVEAPPYTDTFGDFHFSYRYGDVTIPYIRFTEPLTIECQHFVDSIINDAEPQSNGESGLDVVRVLEAAQRSLESAGTVQQIRYAGEGDSVLVPTFSEKLTKVASC
jgi:predicted dehydrogenase